MLLVQDMAPILSFTAEEVFQHLPEPIRGETKTVFALHFQPVTRDLVSAEEKELWDLVSQVRNEVTRAIEPLRKSKELGHSLDSHVTLYCSEGLLYDLSGIDTLRDIFIVSRVTLAPMDQAPETAVTAEAMDTLRIGVTRAPGTKCSRCWVYSEELGTSPEHPEACPRCTRVLQEYHS
jgi:isoleucyl-tRNA synthetase